MRRANPRTLLVAIVIGSLLVPSPTAAHVKRSDSKMFITEITSANTNAPVVVRGFVESAKTCLRNRAISIGPDDDRWVGAKVRTFDDGSGVGVFRASSADMTSSSGDPTKATAKRRKKVRSGHRHVCRGAATESTDLDVVVASEDTGTRQLRFTYTYTNHGGGEVFATQDLHVLAVPIIIGPVDLSFGVETSAQIRSCVNVVRDPSGVYFRCDTRFTPGAKLVVHLDVMFDGDGLVAGHADACYEQAGSPTTAVVHCQYEDTDPSNNFDSEVDSSD